MADPAAELDDAEAFGTRAVIKVPEGTKPGEAVRIILASGQEVVINVPEGAGPGDTLEIDIPDMEDCDSDAGDGDVDGDVETVEVAVPSICQPGDAFTVQASWGGLFEIVVPRGTAPDTTLFVELPGRAPPDYAGPSTPNHPPSISRGVTLGYVYRSRSDTCMGLGLRASNISTTNSVLTAHGHFWSV